MNRNGIVEYVNIEPNSWPRRGADTFVVHSRPDGEPCKRFQWTLFTVRHWRLE